MNSLRKAFFVSLIAALLAGCAAQAPYFKLDPSVQGCVRNIDGYKYVPLAKLCDAYKLACDWDAFTRTASLSSGSEKIVLMAGSRNVLLNGKPKRLECPVVFTDGAVFVPVSFARSTFQPPEAPGREGAPVSPVAGREKAFTIKTIVLDTGHGGKDAGAVGRGKRTREKDTALLLAKKVRKLLEDAGINVVMVRANDTFIPLQRRCDIANDSAADIFVSIHINASYSRGMRGFECYYLSNATDDNARALEAFEDSSLKLSDGADAEHSNRLDKTLWDMALTENRRESAELAGDICRSVDESQLIRNNGVKTARFYVLKHTHIPAVLVEAGYISNRMEEKKLRDPRFLDKMAEAIVRGILRYRNKYESTDGFTNV